LGLGSLRFCITPFVRGRLRRRRSLFSRSQRFHVVMEFIGRSRVDVKVLPVSPMTVEPQQNLVLSRREVKPLERTVEVIHYTRIVPIHVDFRLLRFDLGLNRAVSVGIVHGTAGVVGITHVDIRCGVAP
jgi:hypothetical protein